MCARPYVSPWLPHSLRRKLRTIALPQPGVGPGLPKRRRIYLSYGTQKPSHNKSQLAQHGSRIARLHEYADPTVSRSSPNALSEPDENPLRAANVAEAVDVLVLNHFADELSSAFASTDAAGARHDRTAKIRNWERRTRYVTSGRMVSCDDITATFERTIGLDIVYLAIRAFVSSRLSGSGRRLSRSTRASRRSPAS